MSDKLQTGLSILYDLELNNYLMAKTISKLNNEINALGKAKKINEPVKSSSESGALFWVGASTTVVAMVGGIVGAIRSFIKSSGFFFRLIVAFGGAIEGAIIGAIIGLIIGIIVGLIAKSSTAADDERKYKDACERYEKDVSADRIRVKNELKRRDFLIQEKNALVTRRNESNSKLRKYYDTIGIDQKYRNLVPMGYMNEFARLGISTKLEGADGLYYLVSKELRYDQFQCSLNDIAYKLDTIIDNQSEVYANVLQMNKQCDRLINLTLQSAKNSENKLNQIAESTSIAAYNSERISQELTFQNFMLYY